MKHIRWQHTFLAFALILAILPFSAARSQSGNDIRINLVSTLETPDAVTVKVYFNLYDPRSGTPILGLNAENAQVTLLNTSYRAEGVLKQPDVPIYVTLVLDSSGSMAGSAAKLQDAARLALNNTPNNSLFAVVQFDEEIKLLQDFTQNIPAASYAIDQYKPSNRGTCLYDAAYSAVEAQSKVPAGRRAVILFTDGKDEKRDGSLCSKHTYQELVTLASNLQVPVHTIALSDQEARINALELGSLAASTGGFSYIANQADLGQAFTSIMDALKAQWMVEAVVYPRKGNNDALLTLGLRGGAAINTAFTIRSETDYSGPPVPVSAQFAGLVFHYLEETCEIQLSLTSPELVGYIKASIWDKRAGAKIDEFVFENVESFNTFVIPAGRLNPGTEYSLRLLVVNRADQVPFPAFADSQGKRLAEYTHDFTYDPTSTYPHLEIQTVVQQGNDLAVTVSTQNREWIDRVEGWLVNENTNTKEARSDFSNPVFAQDVEHIVIPMEASQLPDGKYTVVVRLLGRQNQVFETAEYKGVVYKATREPLLAKIVKGLLGNLVILFAIFFIILALVVFFMVYSMRSKSLTGTPVMQGRLGGGLKGSSKASRPLPLATDEPIPPVTPARKPIPPAQAAQTPAGSRGGAPGQAAPGRQAAPSVQRGPAQKASLADLDAKTLVDGIPAGDRTQISARPQELTPMITVVSSPSMPAMQGRRVILDKWPFVIGRHEVSLVIQDASISRQHAHITFDRASQRYFVTDLNSSNGTRLNGQPLVPGQTHPLTSSATLQLGPNVTVRFDLV